jgi:hypothetical protein
MAMNLIFLTTNFFGKDYNMRVFKKHEFRNFISKPEFESIVGNFSYRLIRYWSYETCTSFSLGF